MGIYDLVVQRIYELCRERDITPNALSYLAGISQSTVKSILNGESRNPGIVTLKKCVTAWIYQLWIFLIPMSLKCLNRSLNSKTCSALLLLNQKNS